MLILIDYNLYYVFFLFSGILIDAWIKQLLIVCGWCSFRKLGSSIAIWRTGGYLFYFASVFYFFFRMAFKLFPTMDLSRNVGIHLVYILANIAWPIMTGIEQLKALICDWRSSAARSKSGTLAARHSPQNSDEGAAAEGDSDRRMVTRWVGKLSQCHNCTTCPFCGWSTEGLGLIGWMAEHDTAKQVCIAFQLGCCYLNSSNPVVE